MVHICLRESGVAACELWHARNHFDWEKGHMAYKLLKGMCVILKTAVTSATRIIMCGFLTLLQ